MVASALTSVPAAAHRLRAAGEAVSVADSDVYVTPTRDWNKLDGNAGKRTELWTLDGEQLNAITFFGGIKAGDALVKERDKKRDPLPKFSTSTLLIEVPELLEGTYRTYKDIGAFELLSINPAPFLGNEGIEFTFEYLDADQLTRKGEARAAIIDGELYMAVFDAPRLHYFDLGVPDFRTVADSATLR
jgi:hypothetical protein